MNHPEEFPELISPSWQQESKLIGYGIDSLVFRPPFLVPNDRLFPEAAQKVKQNPSGFVGLITTYELFKNEIRETTKRLRKLMSGNVSFSDMTVLPVCFSANQDFLSLPNEQVQHLVEQHHAVRKKVEYQKTWSEKTLVQMIYPYGGISLAELCNHPENAPAWSDFFRGMAEVARFIRALHAEGYVHGDLSPNNVLYDEQNSGIFRIVDWKMFCLAEDFLKQKKGLVRVGCWSPEHFSLTTSGLESVTADRQWLIYAAEMQKYISRLMEFCLSHSTAQSRDRMQEYFEPFLASPEAQVFEHMYSDLRALAKTELSAIGKYHDTRYLIDTIAKAVHAMFPKKTEAQQEQYDSFISLCLMQNLPEREIYLHNPRSFMRRLIALLESCRYADDKNEADHQDVAQPTATENMLLSLLRSAAGQK